MSNSWPYHQAAATSIRAQATQIAEWLYNSFAKERGGTVKVMPSMKHLWSEIYDRKKDEPTILIVWNGETSRGGFNVANTLHRVDRQWLVIVLRGHGWRNLEAPSDVLVPTPSENTRQYEDFYDTVECLRDKIRVMLSISEEFPIDYKSTNAMPGLPMIGQSGNLFIDGYQISFSTANDIPAITLST